MCTMCVLAAHRDQKRVSDSLELELQMVVSHLTWVLEIESQDSGREASALNHEPSLQFPLPPILLLLLMMMMMIITVFLRQGFSLYLWLP